MFSFKPVKWFSSLLLSKFLKPYIKNFESQNIDVQILDGEVCLKQLELRNDILMQFGIDIEVIDSSFGEVKLLIPWNNLKTKEISVQCLHRRFLRRYIYYIIIFDSPTQIFYYLQKLLQTLF